MRVATVTRQTRPEYQREYWEKRKGLEYNAYHRKMWRAKVGDIPEFVAVDSEGIDTAYGHRAVLLGIGTDQYENARGLRWEEVFSHLYRHSRDKPRAALVGFYLGYDFNQWFRTLPKRPAWELLTPEGKASRKPLYKGNSASIPVRYGGWEFDMMGFKRLAIRPGVCECRNVKTLVKCEHEQNPWAYLCDTGSFFQMGLLQVLAKENWILGNGELTDWPCTEPVEGYAGDALYELVKIGKDRRASAALDDEMRLYNRVENVLLARAMGSLAKGFHEIGIDLRRNQWYGPGAAAAHWLRNQGAPKRTEVEKLVPDYWLGLCKASYYGGWFEIFSHGILYGSSYNYDINNAYPYAIKNLPCMAHAGKTGRRKDGQPREKDGRYILVYATVGGASNRIGPMPHRRKNGNIVRPKITRGWYWLDEIQASQRAGLVKSYTVHEWAWFDPCQCGKPFTDIQVMYDKRRTVGKNTSQGKAIKLTNNSGYGKFAQNVGSAPYGNWFYASRITASCRIQILDAISTHPGGPDSVCMVATDGICFDSPHPDLPVSKLLGEWDYTEYTDLTLFKPGVYWHKSGKDAILKAKTRGVPKKGLLECIDQADFIYAKWHEDPERFLPGRMSDRERVLWEGAGLSSDARDKWPWMMVPVGFRLTSCAQALNMGKWEDAGRIEQDFEMLQDSDPHLKRYVGKDGPIWNSQKQRVDTLVHPQGDRLESYPYGVADIPPDKDWGYGLDGPVENDVIDAFAILRDVEWTVTYDAERLSA